MNEWSNAWINEPFFHEPLNPESLFKPKSTDSRTATLPNSLVIFGWHDDVVETGCGWHDGDNADHANCIFQICPGAVSFNNVNVKSSSRCSPVDILIQELNHTNPKTPLKPSVFIYATVSCAFCRANSTTQIQSCSKRDIFLSLFCENELLLQSHANFARPHLPKALRTRQFFLTLFMWNWALAYSLVHILPTSSSKKCSEHVSFFLNIFIWNQVPVHISADLPKVLRTWQFSTFSNANRGPRYSPVHCSSTNFCRSRPGTPETKTLLRRPRKPLHPQKTHSFAPEMNSGILRCYFPTTWWWCGWHDAVVDMMVRMLAVTIVCNSEGF